MNHNLWFKRYDEFLPFLGEMGFDFEKQEKREIFLMKMLSVEDWVALGQLSMWFYQVEECPTEIGIR